MIALALIVKGTNEEAELLDRCLENVLPHVDKAFITSTYPKGKKPNKEIERVCLKHGADISYYEWTKDFASARNFNFSQVPKEYEYILWCDADDVFRGLETLREIIKENPQVDAFAFNYLYDFDKYNNPIVVHKKTQVVRNDGCVEWQGRLHEDFKENRALNVQFVEGIERMHFTSEDRIVSAQKRNVEISEEEAELNPNDPRSYFNLANSYLGAGESKKAKKAFEHFIETSLSDDEKYVAYQRLASVENTLGNKKESILALQIAIGMKPEIPDAYHQLGYLYFEYNMLDKAESYLLRGLLLKPQYHSMIVYNPRDYDYNPMMLLAKVYFSKSRPDLALPLVKGCLQIYPKDTYLQGLVKEMEMENDRMSLVLNTVNDIEIMGDDKVGILTKINTLPVELQSHPAICRIRNKYLVKETSSGKDIAYYCGETKHEWNPEMAKTKGIGGSEEAVINLAKHWVKEGYNVTVYNSCGHVPMEVDGVLYKPFWYYNPNDKYDITILWRSPRLADYEVNSSKIFVDLHDVIPHGEFNEKRLKKIDKIFVKTNAHRALFPNVPDEKFVIIPNGQDFALFDHDVKRDPYLLINTSSPDRSMDVLPELFMRVKEQVPQAKLKWAYGWEIFDNANENDMGKIAWRNEINKKMVEAGIENLGRLSQKETGKLYKEGRIFAYPSEFYEIDCISAKKAQAGGAIPITTDFAAFEESVQYGVKIKSKKTKDNWCKDYQFHFGIEDEEMKKQWVDAVVAELKKPMVENEEMKEWAKKFDWFNIVKQWVENF